MPIEWPSRMAGVAPRAVRRSSRSASQLSIDSGAADVAAAGAGKVHGNHPAIGSEPPRQAGEEPRAAAEAVQRDDRQPDGIAEPTRESSTSEQAAGAGPEPFRAHQITRARAAGRQANTSR